VQNCRFLQAQSKRLAVINKPIIVFEHGLGAADYYNTRPEQVFELLSSCGLCISSLSGFLRRRRSFTKEEFTKIFYNRIDYYFVAHIPECP